MRLHLKEYMRLPFIVLACGLLLMFAVDFIQRVWRPLNPQDAAISQFSDDVLRTDVVADQPAYLARWLQNSNQNQGAAKPDTETETLSEVVAMPGSSQLNNENIRIRAIFISGETKGAAAVDTQAQAMAVAEVQNIETGTLKRVILRAKDTVSGWEVKMIDTNSVLLTKNNEKENSSDKQKIELYVFEPISNAQIHNETINKEPKNTEDMAPEDKSGVTDN